MPAIDLSILNQRQTPAFYADVFANRPAAGFVGRIFVSTNTFAFYRDNGTGWDLIGGPGTGTITGSGAAGQVSFWNGASTITGENNLWWDSANNHLGINTNTPATALDVNHNGTLVAKFNNTTSANSLIAFENAGNEQWWIGTENTNNDFLFYDATNFPTLSLRTTFKTNGQVLIGGGSTGSGKLVVESATSDNGIQIVGANAPSLRIDSAATGPTKRIGLGISTATNNFIQGSADRDMCIFNGSTTASPMLFGIYDTTNVQEAARISAARNFLIGTTTDGGQKLQVNGGARATGYYLDGMTAGSGALYYSAGTNRVTLANYNASGILLFEVNGGNAALTLNSDLSATFNGEGVLISNAGTPNLQLRKSGVTDWGNIQYDGSKVTIGTFGGGQSLNITTGGNVLIGTSVLGAPTGLNDLLTIGKVSSTSTGVNFTDGTSTRWGFIYANNTKMVYGSFGNTTFEVGPTATEAARFVGTTGNLLIGQTTDIGYKLQVSGNQYIKDWLYVGNNSANVPAVYIHQQGNLDDVLRINMTNINTYAIKFLWYDTNMAGIQVNAAGSAVAYNTTFSDINKKKNFENWNDNILDLFKTINPQKFNFINEDDSAQKTKGFIAQELVDKFPEAYPINDEGFYTFNPSGMVTYLMKAIQELNTKIENLK